MNRRRSFAERGLRCGVLAAAMAVCLQGASSDLSKLPLFFEQNRGQSGSDVKYLSRTAGGALFLSSSEATLAVRNSGSRKSEILRFRWLNAAPASITGESQLPGISNYLTGADRHAWRKGVPHFAQVRYSGIYKGVDLIYYGSFGSLEYDLIVAAGASPSTIRFRVDGAKSVEVDRGGDLVLHLADGQVRHRKPVAYQQIGEVRRSVEVAYSVSEGATVGFRLGKYDLAHPLVIDPVVLYGAYFGGTSVERADDVAVDTAGNAVVVGQTLSSDVSVPNAIQSGFGGNVDAFVMKVNAAGTQVLFATYLGGDNFDAAHSVALDSQNNIYVAGETASQPFAPASLRTVRNGALDAFAVKIAADGRSYLAGTYIGGAGLDYGTGIAVDAANNVYVTGYTNSATMHDVVGSGLSGAWDAFVAKINANWQSFAWTSYHGGAGVDRARAIAVMPSGDLYIGGETTSSNLAGAPFQPSNRTTTAGTGANETCGSGTMCDGFVAKLTAGGNRTYWAYLGGYGNDAVRDIAVDADARPYVVGETTSVDFPVVNAVQGMFGGGGWDGFLTRLNSLGTAIEYSTYIGAESDDFATAVAVDAARNMYVAGDTASDGFPRIASAKTTTPSGRFDGFVVKLNATGNTRLYSSLVGGTEADRIVSLALNSSGEAYVVGLTLSSNFPATMAGNSLRGPQDAFLARLGEGVATSPVAPVVESVSPNTGSGMSQTFTVTYRDDNGAATVNSAYFLVNAGLYGISGCLIRYDRATNQLWLLDDAGSTMLGPVPPGGGALSNGQCTLGPGVLVNAGVTGLRIDLPLSFASTFGGSKNLYAYVEDTSGLSSGWVVRGTYSVPQQPLVPPTIQSLVPASAAGSAQTFTATLSDANGASDLAVVYMLVHPLLDGKQACMVQYIRPSNQLWLLNDAGTQMLGPITPGSGSVSNSQCTLDGRMAVAYAAGTELSLTVPLMFTPASAGSKNVYLYAADASGLTAGWTQVGNYTVVPPPARPPAVTGIVPNTGVGLSQTFTATFSDPNGGAQIVQTYVLFNYEVDGTAGCMIRYDRASNVLWLLNDPGTGVLGPITPGSGSLSNSQCTLQGAGASVAVAGNEMKLTLPVTFTTAFANTKNVYMYAMDAGGLSSGWVRAGEYTIPAKAPTVTGVSPAVASGPWQTFTASYADTDGGADIAVVYLLVNSELDATRGCLIQFNRITNEFRLANDPGTELTGPLSGANGGTLSNSQCTLNRTGALAMVTGNELRVSFPLSFTSSFAGPKKVFMYASDSAGLVSGWQQPGVFTVTAGGVSPAGDARAW